MQIRVFSAVAAALALMAPMTAYAQTVHGQARLVAAATAPTGAKINGLDWRCEGETCAAEGDRASTLDSFMRECRKVSAALGPLAEYSARGRTATASDLAACNQAAAGSSRVAQK